MKDLVKVILILFTVSACGPATNKESADTTSTTMKKVKTLSASALKVRDYVVKNAVIAHRGSTYWTPEETEPAFRWARNIGADYLELDLQKTKDGILIALHDSDLSRTSNVEEVFPERKYAPALEFTLKELRSLDVGSWFNEANPDRANPGFVGLKVLTLRDVIMIAEGYRLKMENGEPVKEMVNDEWTGFYVYEKDPADNGNRPGVYAETKKADLEELLAKELAGLGWDINHNPKQIPVAEGKVDVANTNGRFVLQSFSKASIQKLEQLFPEIPKCLLLWEPNMADSLEKAYVEAINFGVEQNVHFIGSSIAGAPNNYGELTAPWMAELIHSSGMYIHPYTFDSEEQLATYSGRVEGVFTNRADLALKFYNRLGDVTAGDVLTELGY